MTPGIGRRWPDGTPVLPDVQAPWGIVPAERWVRVMAEIAAPGVWDASGCSRFPDELPISAALCERIARWQAWHDDLDARNTRFPKPMHWEQRDDMPVGPFNAEGRAIGRAMKAELPSDWTVIVHDVDAWCRPRGDGELILRAGE